MQRRKCIYCGCQESESQNFSESDIIPFSLKYKRILNRNVCQPEHNSKFGKTFEKDVTDALALFSNITAIKTRKNGIPYADYPVDFELNGTTYHCKHFSSFANIFSKGKAYRSSDNKILLKSYEELMNDGKTNIEAVDVNTSEIVVHTKIPYAIYFTTSMFRLMAKIAFEWYCKENNIHDKDERFASITNYIINGTNNTTSQNIVEIVTQQEIYDIFDGYFSPKSHILFCYHDEYGNVFCMISLFGILVYRIWLCNDYENKLSEKRLFYYESIIDGSETSKKVSSFTEAKQLMNQSPYVKRCDNTLCPIDDKHYQEYTNATILVNLYLQAQNISTTKQHNPSIQKILLHRINQMINEDILHPRLLKKFVSENKLTQANDFNLQNTAGQFWFL